MSSQKEEYFTTIRNWFLAEKQRGENEWPELIAKYGNEHYFGRMLRNAGHESKIKPNEIHDSIDFQLYWDYENIDGFYFNALSADLKKGQFEELKHKFTELLGEPDEIFDFYDLGEPKWSENNVTLSLYHVDTHGSGYEKIGVKLCT